MSTPSLSARIVTKPGRRWSNKHENFSVPVKGIFDIWNPDGAPGRLEGMKATVRTLQELIGRAITEGVRIRALGSGWSISQAAATDGWLINTKPLNWAFAISDENISPEYEGDRDGLLFAQCGVSILELNNYLAGRGRSLRTSGASNGQTIVGAMSTGTHGSALDAGSIPDFVTGMHLIPAPDRHVWLERASAPVTTDRFAGLLGAELIRDDELFNAVLVSFGSFGIIHGALIETDPAFLIEGQRRRMPFDDDLRDVIRTLDFSRIDLPRPGERPYHFEIVLNPHDLDRGAHVTVMYRRPYRADYPRAPRGGGRFRPGDDFLAVVGELTGAVPGAIPAAVNNMMASVYAEYEGRFGTLGEIFSATSIRGRATGCAIGVPLPEALRAVDAILDLHSAHGPFPGVIALRYVRRCEAMLGPVRFDMTCVVDLDGVQSAAATAFFKRAVDALKERQIPFTLHWGKAAEFSPDLVRYMYGEDRDRWINRRKAFLGPEASDVFSSRFLEACGLA